MSNQFWWTKRCCKQTVISLVIVSVSAIAVIKRHFFYVILRIEDNFDFVFVEINFFDKEIDEYLFVFFLC